MEVLPVHLEHVLQAGVLPSHHKDPFGRLLIVQAKAEGLTMMTRDKQFGRYEVPIES